MIFMDSFQLEIFCNSMILQMENPEMKVKICNLDPLTIALRTCCDLKWI